MATGAKQPVKELELRGGTRVEWFSFPLMLDDWLTFGVHKATLTLWLVNLQDTQSDTHFAVG